MKNFFSQSWLVLMLAICFGVILAGVQIGLSERIATNQLNKTLDKIPSLVPGAIKEKAEEAVFEFEIKNKDESVTIVKETAYKAVDKDDQQIGWVISAIGDGYADKIGLLIGVSLDGSTITGIDVLTQKETPALGDKIKTEEFRDQFRDKPTANALAVEKEGGEIVAITAATVSSDAVCDIINAAVKKWKPKLNASE